MTIDELRDIATRLANGAYVRYYTHFNNPCRSPWVMALQARDEDGRVVRVLPLDAIGFRWDEAERLHLIDRTNEDGTPYGSPP
jgi:hypothetical protein